MLARPRGREPSTGETGVVLIYAAGAIVVVFLVIALAFEAADLMLAQQRLSRALDMGSIASGRFLGDKTVPEIQTIAEEVSRTNLAINGLDPSQVNPAATVNAIARPMVVSVTGSFTKNLLGISTLGSTQLFDPFVSSRAQAERVKDGAIAVLVVDITKSIAGFSDDLSQGYREFVEHFDGPLSAELGVVLFDHVIYPLKAITPNVDSAGWPADFDAMVTKNQETDPRMIRLHGPYRYDYASHLVPALDFAIWMLEQRVSHRTSLLPSDAAYLSAADANAIEKMIIVVTDGVVAGEEMPPIRTYTLPFLGPDEWTGSGVPRPDERAVWGPVWDSYGIYDLAAGGAYNQKLSGISYERDFACHQCEGRALPRNCPNQRSRIAADARAPMEMAIGLADYARERGITVHTVGFGGSLSATERNHWPYQRHSIGTFGIRPYFLKRLANDPVHYHSFPSFLSASERLTFHDACSKLKSTTEIRSLRPGLYAEARDASRVVDILDHIGNVVTLGENVRLVK